MLHMNLKQEGFMSRCQHAAWRQCFFPNQLCSIGNVGVLVLLSHPGTLKLKGRRPALGGDGSKSERDRILSEAIVCAGCQCEFLRAGGNVFFLASAFLNRDTYSFWGTRPEAPGGQDRAHNGISNLTLRYRALCKAVQD